MDIEIVDTTTQQPVKGHRLSPEQAQAIAKVAVSGRQLDLLVGPAGAGKTTALRALKRAWTRQHGRNGVVGLAPSAAAAAVLADELGIGAENTAKWWWGVTTTAGAGASPAPWTSDEVSTGPADSAGPSAPTGVRETMTSWVSTHRRCAWSEPMSTTESGPSSATPNWSKTVRNNRRQPVNQRRRFFRRVSPCELPAASGHRNPITYGASEAEVTRDNRYSGEVGDQPISV